MAEGDLFVERSTVSTSHVLRHDTFDQQHSLLQSDGGLGDGLSDLLGSRHSQRRADDRLADGSAVVLEIYSQLHLAVNSWSQSTEGNRARPEQTMLAKGVLVHDDDSQLALQQDPTINFSHQVGDVGPQGSLPDIRESGGPARPSRQLQFHVGVLRSGVRGERRRRPPDLL
jgi:hypothetical protein